VLRHEVIVRPSNAPTYHDSNLIYNVDDENDNNDDDDDNNDDNDNNVDVLTD